MNRQVESIIVNCRQIDTQYRVLSHIGNSLLEEFEQDEIFTGWPTDRVFNELVRRMDQRGGVFVIVLDEIDHLVRKAGDDLLYNLTNMNSSLKTARSCVNGISNDLKFTDFSTLGFALDWASWTFFSDPTMLSNSKTFCVNVPETGLWLRPLDRA